MSARHVTMKERVAGAQAALVRAALATRADDASSKADLFAAANEYAFACWLAAVGRAEAPAAKVLFSFGRAKNRSPAETNTAQLEWYRDALRESVADAAKARWRVSNEEMLAAVEAELALREGGR